MLRTKSDSYFLTTKYGVFFLNIVVHTELWIYVGD